MDDFQMINLVLGVFNIIIIPLVAFLYRYIHKVREENRRKAEEMKQRTDMLNEAMIASLSHSLMECGTFFCRLGAIPGAVKRDILIIGNAYISLGGNGEGHQMLENLKKLPIDNSILYKWQERQQW